MNTIQPPRNKIAQDIKTRETPRSAWDKGVLAFALDLLESYEPNLITREGLLNGARNWKEFSYGGCYFIYDCDIAEALCSPSELKKKRGGALPPNSRESWLDVQARALSQASRLILHYANHEKLATLKRTYNINH